MLETYLNRVLGKNWKTSAAGVVAVILAVAQSVAFFLGNPITIDSVVVLVGAITAAFAGFSAEDSKKDK